MDLLLFEIPPPPECPEAGPDQMPTRRGIYQSRQRNHHQKTDQTQGMTLVAMVTEIIMEMEQTVQAGMETKTIKEDTNDNNGDFSPYVAASFFD